MENTSEMRQKVAVVFAKSGPAIYHSHHDLIRFWERAVKRAALPVRLTQGFNPRPRIIFPHAMGVGIASRHEEVELELCEIVPLDVLLQRIRLAVGGALEVVDARSLPPVKKSRQLQTSSYRIANWPKGAGGRLAAFASDLLERREIRVERGAPGNKREVDIRPYLAAVAYNPVGNTLDLTLRHTPTGGGRPDEIARLAAEDLGCDRHDLRMEKIGMVLE